jgi:NADH-quinone oxidoreductase subunit J
MIMSQNSLLLMLDSSIFFYIFSVFLVGFACMLVLSKHPVFSLLFLVSCFILSAFLLFILECEFLALLFIIIYVGAIAVLFLFAIMMLESKLQNLVNNSLKYVPVSLFFGFFFFILRHLK